MTGRNTQGSTSLTRRGLTAVEFAGRYATAGRRPVPDFIILGAQRSGTTSLYRWLTARDDVAAGMKKEVHYFDNKYGHSLRWYRSHFPLRRPGRITGESCPYLLVHPLAPARVAADLPESTRFIVLLREPVQRAISNYWLGLRLDPSRTETLEEAIDREPARMAAETPKLLRGEVSLDHMAHSYMTRGEYAPQLRRWFDAVGRDRILILESEKLNVDPTASARALRFLGLEPNGDPFPMDNSAPRLTGVSPELLARMQAHFAPFNQDLFELLGYELWSGDPPAAPRS